MREVDDESLERIAAKAEGAPEGAQVALPCVALASMAREIQRWRAKDRSGAVPVRPLLRLVPGGAAGSEEGSDA